MTNYLTRLKVALAETPLPKELTKLTEGVLSVLSVTVVGMFPKPKGPRAAG
jgi:hypothetical protein